MIEVLTYLGLGVLFLAIVIPSWIYAGRTKRFEEEK